jgi:multidrug efflux pump subunit AcrB
MLRWVLGSSLQYRSLVLAAAAALMCLGVYRLRDVSVDVLPEFSPPIIQIQTEALGLSAVEVEDLVTLNLEEILTSVSWLKAIRSSSMTGLSAIDLLFEPGRTKPGDIHRVAATLFAGSEVGKFLEQQKAVDEVVWDAPVAHHSEQYEPTGGDSLC